MKTALIINPKSASGNTVKMWREIQIPMQRRMGAFEVYFTEYPHHAEQLAQEFAEKNYERLILMGGDGTINEVVNGLMDENGENRNPNLKVGILNSGRGCDFIRTLNIPTDPLHAISKLVDMKTQRVDLARVTLTEGDKKKIYYYVNSCSYGLGGEVAKTIQRNDSFLPPQFMYFSASVMGFLKSEPYSVEFAVDGGEVFKKDCMNIFVMNGRFSGGGMDWAPQARLDDGLLDLIILEKVPKIKLALITPKVYDGTFLNLKEVYFKQIKKVTMKANKRLWIETDGEVHKSSDLEIQAISKAIEFIC